MLVLVDGWQTEGSAGGDGFSVTIRLHADGAGMTALVNLLRVGGSLDMEQLYREQLLQLARDMTQDGISGKTMSSLRERAKQLVGALDAAQILREIAIGERP